MGAPKLVPERIPLYLALAAPAAGLVSIAASHILIGAALASLLWRRDMFRLPPLWLPAACFILATTLSLTFSSDPAAGLPQIRKFYVWFVLLIVYSAVRKAAEARWLLTAMVAVASLSALWSFVQFLLKYLTALRSGDSFYRAYIAARITGFMSHWMTFSGELVIALAIVAAFLLFGRPRPLWVWWTAAGAIGLALLLGLTRSMWAAAAVALLYLVWCWRRWMVLVLPVAGVLLLAASPDFVRSRVRSVYQPDPRLDSNLHRTVLRQTGLRMIAAHPFLGVGPEQVAPNFERYMPPDAPRPIPVYWYYRHLHNVYIHYAAERGLPALLALLWLLGKCLWDFLQALRRLAIGPSDHRWILQAATAALIGVAVGAWWEVNLGDSEVLAALWAVLASGYVVIRDTTEPVWQPVPPSAS